MGGGNKSYRGGPFVGAHQNTRCESGVFFANERHGGLNGKAGPREARRLDSIFRSEPSVEVSRLIRAFASIESQSNSRKRKPKSTRNRRRPTKTSRLSRSKWGMTQKRQCHARESGHSGLAPRAVALIGVGKAFASPPSEPYVRFSRIRLSSRWFPHRESLALS